MARPHDQNLKPGDASELINAAAARLVGGNHGPNLGQTVEALQRLLSAVGGGAATTRSQLEGLFGHLPLTILENAMEILGPKDALALILEGDSSVLVRRVLAANYLAQPEIPLYSRTELASQIEQFVAYLERDRDHIAKTGLPRRCFRASWWLYRLLARLYDTRCTGSPYPQDELRSDWAEDTPAYTWGRDIPSVLKVGELQLKGSRFERCEYEEASYLFGMSPDDAARIEANRATLFQLKLEVLSMLASALRGQNAYGLWDSCLELLASRLSAEDVVFFFRMDAFYLGDDIRQGGSEGVSRRVIPGGLTNLLEVVGHVEEEITVGTMTHTQQALARLFSLEEGGGRPFDGFEAGRAYLESITHYDGEEIDDALDLFLALAPQEEEFWMAYRRRIAGAFPGRFPTGVTVTTTVPFSHAAEVRLRVQLFADYCKSHLAETGELPSFNGEPTAAVAPAQATSSTGKKPLVRFPSPPDLCWDEVTLVFISDSEILAKARGKLRRYTCAQLGFQDARRGGPPDSRWLLLRGFAVCDLESVRKLLKPHSGTVVSVSSPWVRGGVASCESC